MFSIIVIILINFPFSWLLIPSLTSLTQDPVHSFMTTHINSTRSVKLADLDNMKKNIKKDRASRSAHLLCVVSSWTTWYKQSNNNNNNKTDFPSKHVECSCEYYFIIIIVYIYDYDVDCLLV